MNTSICRSTKKTPYEIVFGQKPNNNGIDVTNVNINDVSDIIEEETLVENQEFPQVVNFTISRGKETTVIEDGLMSHEKVRNDTIKNLEKNKKKMIEKYSKKKKKLK